MPLTRVAAIQSSFTKDMTQNIVQMGTMIRDAAKQGAQIILPPELFQGHYFCKEEKDEFFATAYPWREHPVVTTLAPLAGELGVVLPLSIFEKDGPHYYNTLVMVDADGSLMGIYRKTHIPDGPGYEEKFYFRPGNTGFKVWSTRFGAVGVGICWDQWFPEAARAMMLMGADILLYPTAIGAEPEEPELDTAAPWRRAMLGHAVSNVAPVIAANRVGDEDGQVFYGTSFIADHRGEIITEFDRMEEGVLAASFDFADIAKARAAFGFFRDRRPDLYGRLTDQ